MKLIRTEDAAGQVLCHDITQIIPGEFKGARFRKGHVIQPEDIPVLVEAILHRTFGERPPRLSEAALAALIRYSFPGNVRELRNVIERVLILGDGTGMIEARELPGQDGPGAEEGRLVISGTLATLPEVARTHKVKPPTLIVIGSVVQLMHS